MNKACIVILIGVCSLIGLNAQSKNFTNADATTAIDAFHQMFYNPNMKLYTISSDKKGRAAIWVQAIYWDMLINSYKRTHSDKDRKRIDDFYQGGYEQYDKYNWNNHHEWFIYDDMMWWIIALGRGYQATNEPRFLANAASGFYHVWKEAYDTERGGMWWSFQHDSKNACICYPTTIAAMTLFEITNDSDYLHKAEILYKWSRDVFFDAQTGLVADNMHYHIQRINSMDIDRTTQLYNQGTCIGAAVMLYKHTGDKQYLKDAILCADYVRSKMCSPAGMLEFKNGVEQGIYGAIFAQYIVRLIEDGHQSQYIPWLKDNINTAWSNRNEHNITFKDPSIHCPTDVIESYDASTCPALMQVVKP